MLDMFLVTFVGIMAAGLVRISGNFVIIRHYFIVPFSNRILFSGGHGSSDGSGGMKHDLLTGVASQYIGNMLRYKKD